jgi:Holliday junction DNA helicase RuvA
MAIEANTAVLEVGGVGYQVNATAATLRSLSLGAEAYLFTSLIIREDAHTLFAFLTFEEQQIFDLLRSVTGVGPKSALAVLAQLSVDAIKSAVVEEKDSVFKSVSGIGPKTAKLITLTLAGKLQSSGVAINYTEESSNSATVIAAITGLGWPERLSEQAVALASREGDLSTDELLRAALAQLGASKSVGATDE